MLINLIDEFNLFQSEKRISNTDSVFLEIFLHTKMHEKCIESILNSKEILAFFADAKQ